jgi:hypothetical protein
MTATMETTARITASLVVAQVLVLDLAPHE